jgi:hypothetical protein
VLERIHVRLLVYAYSTPQFPLTPQQGRKLMLIIITNYILTFLFVFQRLKNVGFSVYRGNDNVVDHRSNSDTTKFDQHDQRVTAKHLLNGK